MQIFKEAPFHQELGIFWPLHEHSPDPLCTPEITDFQAFVHQSSNNSWAEQKSFITKSELIFRNGVQFYKYHFGNLTFH